ncbi:MAG: hypothetical protein Q9190_007070 [Brigantiaea leucoxantha]
MYLRLRRSKAGKADLDEAREQFYNKRYPKAEQLLRQSVQEREKKYPEAEQLWRQSIQEREKVLGVEHKDTIESERRLRELLLAITRPASVSITPEKIVLSRLSDFFVKSKESLEQGEEGQHCHFRRDKPLPFETKSILGSGGFGQVDKILSLISFKEYALKRVPRNKAFGGRGTKEIQQFIAEIQILKRLKHQHVAEFVGSYTDPRYMGLITSPVAESDLSTYLARVDIIKYRELRTFFGCLARALEYLHEQNVRHKDIKPSNILVHGGNVLFTDFGLSFDFTDANGSTTVSMVNGMTPRYCAPEVADLEPRNTASDIWSLGIVFLEMAVVLKGKTVGFISDFLKTHGSRRDLVRTNRAALSELIAELQETGDISDNRALDWIQLMLSTD